MRIATHACFVAALFVSTPHLTRAQVTSRVVAVFAHADDERIVAPLLAKLARQGRETHLVIATDGSKGIRDFAGIPAGPELAAARAREARCAADRLGVRGLHLLGFTDHRLVGDVMTEIVQRDARFANVDLFYASLPTERLRTAPPARPGVTGMAEALLTVRVPFEERDLAVQRAEYACHRTQYTLAEMDSVNRYLAHAWDGRIWLRPWKATLADPTPFPP